MYRQATNVSCQIHLSNFDVQTESSTMLHIVLIEIIEGEKINYRRLSGGGLCMCVIKVVIKLSAKLFFVFLPPEPAEL